MEKIKDMPDISMCKDFTCPLRKKCYRYTAIPNEVQCYAIFNYNMGCDYFWDNNLQKITKDKGYEPTSKDNTY